MHRVLGSWNRSVAKRLQCSPPFTLFCHILRLCEDPLQVLVNFKSRSYYIILYFTLEGKNICLPQYSLNAQMQFHFLGRSLKFTTKRIRLQYLIFYSTIAWGEIKELAFWDTQGLDEKLRPLAVNSPLHQHCFSIIVKVQPLISFLPQPCPEESRQTDQSFLVSRLLWKDRRFSSQTNLQDQF